MQTAATTHSITDTTRSRTVCAPGSQDALVLHEQLRTLRNGGRAWCIVSAELLPCRRGAMAWPS
jgi:hypothetical protein